MRIYFAGDHAGFELKEKLMEFVRSLGHEVFDLGPKTYDEADDYPDFCAEAAKAVAADHDARGIIIGGSGQGEAMVANRFRGVRAAVYYGSPRSDLGSGKRSDLDIIKLSREHNDSNVLAIGARFASEAEAKRALTLWLDTSFSGEARHARRLQKIDELNH
ncbi:MAG: RpiB/LacA/LacB family sugar-phosphate isomerase [Candidatus Taylorbacteria bacterium]|nr:RpiB/LacA/LacB family sugar-phosphate isomerase [Candidatus Taylorbacteria bacterium]